MIVVSNDILVKEGGSVEETPFEEPFNKEVVDVRSCNMECIDPISIECPPGPIPTSIIMLYVIISLFH